MKNDTLFSILTVNLNNGTGLRKTIDSVRMQTCKKYEFVIIDGKSTDNSIDIIKQNIDIIHYYISESDNGLYDAMNKGLGIVKGDFVVFLNSGDSLISPFVLEHATNKIHNMNFLYFGSCKLGYQDKHFCFFPKENSTDVEIRRWIARRFPIHQSIFFPRSFYMNNLYDLRYKLAGDQDYIQRAMNLCGYSFLNEGVVSFELGGLSTPASFKTVNTLFTEHLMIFKNHKTYTIWKAVGLLKNYFIKFIVIKLFGDDYFRMFINYINKREHNN